MKNKSKFEGGDEEEGDGVLHYTKIRFGKRFGLEDQILLGPARPRFVYTSYLYELIIFGCILHPQRAILYIIKLFVYNNL